MTVYKRRQIISWILMPLAFIPLLVIVTLMVGQLIVRLQMKEKLEKENLVSLRLPQKSLVWAERGKELLIDGRLFDVKSLESCGDIVTVIGIFDEQETNILRQLDRILTGKQNNSEKRDLLHRILVKVTWYAEFPKQIHRLPPAPVTARLYKWVDGYLLPPNRREPFLPPDLF